MHPRATWWKTAVFYEVYVRSFADANFDGVGDLAGVTARLDYLRDLGATAIWITPFYPSPQVDNGYDISDHEDVDPRFGTLADFDRLLSAAHARNIRIVIDIVLNHTSDQHPWFRLSRSSRSSSHREWYVWKDGAPGGGPPNNWESAFGGPAWTLDPVTGQWYYHFFYKEQPDLNWRNPLVEERMFATLDFWLDRGVDGFRLDAVNTLFEDPALRDNPVLPAPRQTITGVYTQDSVYNRRLPEVHDLLRRLRAHVDRRDADAVLISEAYVDTVEDLVCFYGTDDDEMHLPFNFFLAQVPRLEATLFRGAVEQVEHACGARWPSLVLSNHDIARACDRMGPPDASAAVARLLGTLLLTLRGTPFIYYGEEIAMPTEDPLELSQVQDRVGKVYWPTYKGRDGCRRPMKWSEVDAQHSDPRSVLSFFRALLAHRREYVALRAGGYRTIGSHPDVFAYIRGAAEQEVLVALNFSGRAVDAACDVPTGRDWRVVLSSAEANQSRLPRLTLAPFEAVVVAADAG